MASNEEHDYEPLEIYLNAHRDEIIDLIEMNTGQQFIPTGQMFDRLTNQVTMEFPYGAAIDNMHRILTNAIMCAMWCGWFAQARTMEQDKSFNPDYIERFRTIINSAFEMGRRCGKIRLKADYDSCYTWYS